MKKAFMLLSISVVLLASACSTDKNKKNKQEKFLVTNPIILDTQSIQEYVADIHAIQNIEIRTRIRGYIDKIHVDEGAFVKEGELLFTISSQEFKQELNKANAQLKNARAEAKIAAVEVANTETLVDKKIVSQSILEMAKAKLEVAEANVDEAETAILSANLNISFASIKAPFSGRINRLPLKTGSLIDEGTLLTSISNDTEIFAYFHLSEKQYLNFLLAKENNQQKVVKLLMVDGTPFDYEGKIETTESEINKHTGNIAFRARFKNPDHTLKHGSSGKIQLITKLSNAMLIPQKATFEVQELTYVYVVDSTNTVQDRSVEIKSKLPNFYVIKSGLLPSDRVIYEGLQRVKEGIKIDCELKSMNNIMSEFSPKKF